MCLQTFSKLLINQFMSISRLTSLCNSMLSTLRAVNYTTLAHTDANLIMSNTALYIFTFLRHAWSRPFCRLCQARLLHLGPTRRWQMPRALCSRCSRNDCMCQDLTLLTNSSTHVHNRFSKNWSQTLQLFLVSWVCASFYADLFK